MNSKNHKVLGFEKMAPLFYNNNEDDKDTYTNQTLGAMYNYAAIEQCAVCPDGYAIPTKAQFETLIKTAGGVKALIEADLENKTRFIFKGGRADHYGSVKRGNFAQYWLNDPDNATGNTATAIFLQSTGEYTYNTEDKRVAAYVRCIKIK